MFQIHGLTGRIARARIDELRLVSRAMPVARTQGVTPVQEWQAADPSALVQLHQHAPHGDHDNGTRPPALQAYAEVQQAGTTTDRARTKRSQALHWMSSPVVTLRDQQPLAEAVVQLHDRGVSQAPVLDAGGQLVGLLLLKDTAAADTDARKATVHQWMRSPVTSAAPDIDLHQVAAALVATDLPGLPLIDAGGALAGFIARGDLMRAMATERALDLWG